MFTGAIQGRVTQSSVITGDCISQKTWYFQRNTVKQGSVRHFGGEMVPFGEVE